MTPQTIVVDLITLILMLLFVDGSTLTLRRLARKTAPQRVTFWVRLLVPFVWCVPALLWGAYTVARSWHFALTFAETWGVATVALASIIAERLWKSSSGQPAKRHSGV